MFTLYGSKDRCCDGVDRRSFLKVGAMGIGSLSLVDLLRAEAQAGVGSSHKALINIFLAGGPSHTDMFDLKPDAPSEYRGEFNPINTNVNGLQICEHMPNLAKMADKYAVIRSIVGTYDDHTHIHMQSGWHRRDLEAVGGRPSLGAVVSKVQGSTGQAPPFVSLMGQIEPGFLGPIYQPYRPDGPGRANLKLDQGMTTARLSDRTALLRNLDTLKRSADSTGKMEAMDVFTQRAVEMITSGAMADALDVEKEDPKILARYRSGGNKQRNETDGFLIARRLIEAGVRTVSLRVGGWDTHENNFKQLRSLLPVIDASLAALISDLHERGLDKDVTVVMWGEFGRTPRVNNKAGRDHWSKVMQAVVAGGGMRTGQIIGSTDRYGGEASERPVHLREVFATLYRNMGIMAKDTTLPDPAGRPQYLVDDRDPIAELI